MTNMLDFFCYDRGVEGGGGVRLALQLHCARKLN
jgi:hypothetical protein